MARVTAIVPAAGLGRRIGADKALLELAGQSAIERLAAAVRSAGIDELLVVRRADAQSLPERVEAKVVTVDGAGEMADSLRAAESRLAADCRCRARPTFR